MDATDYRRSDDNKNRKAVRMGQHVWLLLATIGTELLAITKWSRGQFTEPLPVKVRWAWTLGGALLLLYPIVQVCSLYRGHWMDTESIDSSVFRVRGGTSDENHATRRTRDGYAPIAILHPFRIPPFTWSIHNPSYLNTTTCIRHSTIMKN